MKFSKDKDALSTFLSLKEGKKPFVDEYAHVGEQVRDFGFYKVAHTRST